MRDIWRSITSSNKTYMNWNSWIVFRHLVRKSEGSVSSQLLFFQKKKRSTDRKASIFCIYLYFWRFLPLCPPPAKLSAIYLLTFPYSPKRRTDVVGRQWVPLFWSTHFVFLLSPAIASPAISGLPVLRMLLLFPRPLVLLLHVAVVFVSRLSPAPAGWTPSCPVPSW